MYAAQLLSLILTAIPVNDSSVSKTIGKHRNEITQLAAEVVSADRTVWMPAASRLNEIAAKSETHRNAVWKAAKVNTLGMRFVEVPAGRFTMGPDVHRVFSGSIPKRVELKQPFLLCVTEVTNAQFETIFKERNRDELSPDADSPVIDVKLRDVAEFCRRLSKIEGVTYRLPTEAEWERACRAGTQSQFSFGESPDRLPEYGWTQGQIGRAAAVAQLKPNQWGFYDMYGNVAEWAWNSMQGAAAGSDCVNSEVDKTKQSGWSRSDFMVRGGAWTVRSPWACASSSRTPYPLFEKKPFSNDPRFGQQVGFRLLREIAISTDSTDERVPEKGEK